jgi:hypothetical protein
MVDTLAIRLNEVALLPGADLTIEQGRINNRTGEVNEAVLYSDTQGKKLIGAKAYHNANNFNLTLDNFGWKLQTSLPKFINGYLNYKPVTQSEASKGISELQSKLENEVGIISDLSKARPMRIDLFKNAELNNSPAFYFPMLSNLPAGRRLKMRDYGDTVLFHNTQREMCFYDKIQEIRIKNDKIDMRQFPTNIMRGEIRLLRGRVIQKDTCINSVAGLLDKWNELPIAYKQDIKGMVFNRQINIPSVLEEVERLRYLKEVSGRQAWQKTKMKYGLYYFASKYTQDEFLKIVSEVFGRFVARKAVKEFYETQLEFKTFDNPKTNTKELYEELYYKFVA